jgi:hypothetical protein
MFCGINLASLCLTASAALTSLATTAMAGSFEEEICRQFQQILHDAPRGVTPTAGFTLTRVNASVRNVEVVE